MQESSMANYAYNVGLLSMVVFNCSWRKKDILKWTNSMRICQCLRGWLTWFWQGSLILILTIQVMQVLNDIFWTFHDGVNCICMARIYFIYTCCRLSFSFEIVCEWRIPFSMLMYFKEKIPFKLVMAYFSISN